MILIVPQLRFTNKIELSQYSNQSFHKIKIRAYTIFNSELTQY